MTEIGLTRVWTRLKDCIGCGFCVGDGPLVPLSDEGIIPEDTKIYANCPPYEYHHFHSYSPRGRTWLAAALWYRDTPITEDLVKVFYTCTTCALCDEVCYLKKVPIVRAMREEFCKRGVTLPEAIQKSDDNIINKDNYFGGKNEVRAQWARGLNLPNRGEVLYFAGCFASYKYPEVARATVSILREAGCDVAYLAEKEICCGSHLLLDGHVEIAMSRITPLIAAVQKSGARTVVFSCAEGYRAFNEYIKELGPVPFEITHVSQLFNKLIGEGKIKFSENVARRVTYHDPCVLGRQMAVYGAPRKVIKSIPGVELLEMVSNGWWSRCCGSGSSLCAEAYPEYAHSVAAQRLKEAKDTADILVTACPQCMDNFGVAAKQYNIDIKTYDLPVFVAEAMGIKIS